MKKDYYINIFYGEEYEGYIDDIPELANCSTFGKTLGEALSEALVARNTCGGCDGNMLTTSRAKVINSYTRQHS